MKNRGKDNEETHETYTHFVVFFRRICIQNRLQIQFGDNEPLIHFWSCLMGMGIFKKRQKCGEFC